MSKAMKISTYEKSTALIKARFKKIQSQVAAVVDTATTVPLTQVHIRSLNSYLSELKKKKADFELNLQRILEHADTEELTETTLSTDVDLINDLFVAISAQIESVLPSDDPRSPLSHHEDLSSSFRNLPLMQANVRLPQLDLKTFDGNINNWVTFINLYDTSVHHNSSLNSVTKMQYLLSALSGDALNLVKSMNISAANYPIAYQLLKDRFHNPRRLITFHLNAILDLPHVTSGQIKGLRNFLNIFTEHTQSLEALQCDITTAANPLLSAHLLRKLDQDLRTKLEGFRSSLDCDTHSLPTVAHIIKFLTTECDKTEDASLHLTQSAPSTSSSTAKYNKATRFNDHRPPPPPRSHALVATQVEDDTSTRTPSAKNVMRHSRPSTSCFVCNDVNHKVYSCPLFLSKTPHERSAIVKNNKRCYSCLGAHLIDTCSSKGSCKTCQKRHHSLLHFEKKTTSALSPPTQGAQSTTSTPLINSVVASAQTQTTSQLPTDSTVLLGTALVQLTSPTNHTHVFRALLDSGSQLSFISERAAQLLNTPRLNSTHNIMGISNISSQTKGLINLDFASISGQNIASQHPFHILNRISADLPRTRLRPEVWQMTRSYVLADPTFHLPGSVDVLIGGALYPLLLTQQSYPLGPDLPYMIGTQLGFVVMGVAPCDVTASPSSHFVTLHSTGEPQDLHSSLQRFWLQEEPPASSWKSTEERLCNDHFVTTHRRNSDGRYVVKLPFKSENPSLGSSLQIAEKRFFSLESKFQSQPEFHRLYVAFMRNCEDSDYMTKITDSSLTSPQCYLPHHGVLKRTGDSAKIRVVYDASCKTSNGISLNDSLLTGPKLQTNICDILLNFRTHKVVFTCDIRQMYLQILVDPPDQNYQLVLWREKPTDPLTTYKLTRVTFGVNSSPYLAIRTLHQLAEDEGHLYPEAAEVLRSQVYVDDVVSGANTLEDARQLRDQLIKLLARGHFELRKWTSNCPELLQTLPATHRDSPVFLKNTDEPHFSILGLHWSPESDSFIYNLHLPSSPPTKRQVLSTIARIYDPCGFLSPCLMTAKCFMQLLWTTGLNWDELLTPDLASKWQTFMSSLHALSDISIPRALCLTSSSEVQLHGFSDASEVGFSAVIYLRSQKTNGDVTIRQILAKTRVAPLKRVTLPRLELCAAHLLAQLVTYCISIFRNDLSLNQCFLWCDSSVALAWLHTPSYRLKTYVANRVSQTQEMIPSHCWRYIPSRDNPADCASRGILASELVDHPLWWKGPPWLPLEPSLWPDTVLPSADITAADEVKPTPLTVLVSTQTPEWDLLSKFSTWTTLVRVTAYVLRFLHNVQRADKRHGTLSARELKNATLRIFKCVQSSSFPDDIRLLMKAAPCSSRLRRLSPFIDENGLIRVGGRLEKAAIPYESKHAVVLPKSHPVVDMFIDYTHKKHLHSGPQLTQAILAETVWILSARSAVRSRLFKCVLCFKHKPRNQPPLMGNLPTARLTPSRPFLSTGIDYGGPFLAKAHTLRSNKHVKVYICIMVCLATKAVHIEMVTDLTTEAFLAALTRFVSRRGLCTDIYSDCGTNFVGANATLRNIVKQLKRSQEEILKFTTPQGINFHFNPPAAPHQGGLWEAAIKSAKHHLKRVLGQQVLAFAEFMTLTTQVEAILNSRPLTPLSNDPSDFSALTPGHFLIGSALTTVPEAPRLDIPPSRLKAWHLVQSMRQHFWKRWQHEYIHTLQQRAKWTSSVPNLKPGDLVLVQQPTPPLSWPLARITEVFPGADGAVRVVKLQTQNSTFTRPVIKVFPLPID